MSIASNKLNIVRGNNKFKFLNYLLLSSFFVFVLVLTTFKIFQDDDIFWHLSTGRYIIQNFTVPSTDVFGFVTSGTRWIPFEWGWDVLTYLIYIIGGFYALSILRTIIVFSILLIILFVIRNNNLSLPLILGFSFILIFGMLTRLSIRPQLITYLFIVLLVYLLYKYKYNTIAPKPFYILFPIVFLIWANMHMGVLFGILIFAVFVISETINIFFISKDKKSVDDKKKLKSLLITFIVSFIVLLINPNFIDTYLYVFRHSQMDMLEQINEWKSPFRAEAIEGYNVKIYMFFLFTGIITLYYSAKRKDYFPFLLYVIAGIYSIQSIRFITDFMLVIFIFWILSLDYIMKNWRMKDIINHSLVKILLTIWFIIVTYNVYNNIVYKEYLGNYFRETGFGINEKYYPKAMFDFIKKENINKIGNKPFNNLKIGGFFIWNFPENKNFIDSRNLNDSIYTLYKNIDSKRYGYESLLDNNDIDYVIYSVPYMTVNATEIERNIISYLSTTGNKWKLVYWDDNSFLFVKNIPKFNDIINRYEYKYITPYNYIFKRDFLNNKYITEKLEVNSELKRKLFSDPNGIIINDIAENLKRIH